MRLLDIADSGVVADVPGRLLRRRYACIGWLLVDVGSLPIPVWEHMNRTGVSGGSIL